jgi:molybdopterin molybdotransferase
MSPRVITYAEAIRIVDEAVAPTETYEPPIELAFGRFLAEDLTAKLDSPRFDNSAVDGYALHESTLTAKRAVVAFEVQAGATPVRPLRAGECARILTGAELPDDTAAVVMQEDCRVEAEELAFDGAVGAGDHIRKRGEDFSNGSTLLRAGSLIGPVQLGIIAASGNYTVHAHRTPRVAVLTSGNEIAPIDSREFGSRLIPNSNAHTLTAALRNLGLDPKARHARDDRAELDRTLTELLDGTDVLITCGGVSVGSYDYLKESFAALGVEQRFWSVAIKPGKPFYFGTVGNRLVFGLPGNPVSALVTYYLLVRPALLKLMGSRSAWRSSISAQFRGRAEKRPGRMEFLRGVLSGGSAQLAGEQGSHQMAALAAANCLIHFPLDASLIKDGQTVEVTRLDWRALE